MRTLVAALGASLILAACGGGGGSADGGPGGPPAPQQAWRGTLPVEARTGQADSVDVAINASGVAYAVWAQEDANRQKIMSSRYINGAWQTPKEVSKTLNLNEDASEPQVAMLPDGRATAIWRQPVGLTNAIVGSATDSNGNWADPVTLQSSQIVEPAGLQLVSNGVGDAIASWKFGNAIFASHFTDDKFGLRELISFSLNANSESVHVTMDPTDNGNALAVWTELDGNGVRKVHSRVFSEEDWNPGAFILSGVNPVVGSVRATLGAGGKAAVVWTEIEGGVQQAVVRTATNAFGNQWQFGHTTLGLPVDESSLQVSMTEDGRAVVAWAQGDDIMASRFHGNGWVNANVESDPNVAKGVQLGMDASGRAFAVWVQFDGAVFSTMANRMDVSTGQWGTPERIETENRGSAIGPALAVNAGGRAMSAWVQQDGSTSPAGVPIGSIVANVFK